MASRDSLSMLVTLELRERVNEPSLASGQQNESEHRNVGKMLELFVSLSNSTSLQMIAFIKDAEVLYA